jgi:hypothetical protein
MSDAVRDFINAVARGETPRAKVTAPTGPVRSSAGMCLVEEFEWDAWTLSALLSEPDGTLTIAELVGGGKPSSRYDVRRLTDTEAAAVTEALEQRGDEKWTRVSRVTDPVWARPVDYSINDLPARTA